jgi:hypothetical protein
MAKWWRGVRQCCKACHSEEKAGFDQTCVSDSLCSLVDIGSEHADRNVLGPWEGQLHPTMWCALWPAIQYVDALTYGTTPGEVLGSRILRRKKCHRTRLPKLLLHYSSNGVAFFLCILGFARPTPDADASSDG